MNRKASVYDSIGGPIYILVVACTIFVAYYVWTTFATNFAPLSDTITLPSGETLTDITTNITGQIGYLDFMFPMMIFGLLFASLIFAYKTGSSIIYSYVSIFMWILALIMAAMFSNIFESFAETLPSVSIVMVTIVWIMSNMKWIALFWAALISLVMFSRDKKETQLMSASERAFG